MSSSKSEFEHTLIFPIRWSSFNPDYWNCFSGEKYWLKVAKNIDGIVVLEKNVDQMKECRA